MDDTKIEEMHQRVTDQVNVDIRRNKFFIAVLIGVVIVGVLLMIRSGAGGLCS